MAEIIHFSNIFSAKARVQPLVQQNRGRALFVVHPFFTKRECNTAGPQGSKTRSDIDYENYFGRLSRSIAGTTMPVFVFHGPCLDGLTSDWIKGLSSKFPIIAVPTTTFRNPTPVCPDDHPLVQFCRSQKGISGEFQDDRWNEFAYIAGQDLGIRTILVGGEIAVIINGEKKGCVFFAAESLGEFFHVKIVPGLIYPDVFRIFKRKYL